MADQSRTTPAGQAVSITQVIHIDEAAIRLVLDQIGRTVRIAVAAELSEIMSKLKATKDTVAPPGSANHACGMDAHNGLSRRSRCHVNAGVKMVYISRFENATPDSAPKGAV